MTIHSKGELDGNPVGDAEWDALIAPPDTARGLRGRSVRGGLATAAGQMLRFGLQILSTAALSRLLAPRDFGIIAMVTAITGFLDLFRDLGLTTATIQRAALSRAEAEALFWINVRIGCLLAIGTAVAAPFIAGFYDEPRLVGVTITLATGFALSGLGAQHLALLRRAMRFRTIVSLDLIGQIAGAAVGIGGAIAGAGLWSLVAATLTRQAAMTLGSWINFSWWPRRGSRASVRSLLVMGGHLTGFNILNYLARQLDNVLIGRVRGAVELGSYSRAYQLLLLPIQQINQPITGVILPVLARLRDEPERFERYYLSGLAIAAAAAFPLVGLTIALADEIVAIVLGPQWKEAAILFRILAGAVVVQPVCNTSGWLFTALGRTDRMFRWGIAYSTLVVTSFILGIRNGARGVATYYTVAMLLQAIPCLWYATRHTPVSLRRIASTVLHPALCAFVATAIAAAMNRGVVAEWSVISRLLVCSVVLCTTYLALLIASPRQRALYRTVLAATQRA